MNMYRRSSLPPINGEPLINMLPLDDAKDDELITNPPMLPAVAVIVPCITTLPLASK